jgi:phenylalanine-4-hydroxylase
MQLVRPLFFSTKQISAKLTAQISLSNGISATSVAQETETEKNEICITIKQKFSSLGRILNTFEENKIPILEVKRILSNQKIYSEQDTTYHITFDAASTPNLFNHVLNEISSFANIAREGYVYDVPWFPISIKELNMQARDLIPIEGDDHPLYWDKEYQKRRNELADISKNSKIEEPISYLNYTEKEKNTWTYVYDRIRPLHAKYMCKEYNEVASIWEKECNVTSKEIPQLEDVSQWLRSRTGFRMKPVHGILSSRQFLNGLAFKVFYCTQYVRHHERPEYSPEPDVLHELFGHASMLGDQTFADLSQQFGLLSLGASDENLAKLGALYWYTVEAGACKENSQVKAFGASISSSIAELQHFASEKANYRTLDPFKELPFDIKLQFLQQKYYVAQSFKGALEVLLKFGESLQRPFSAWYNTSTEKIEVDKKIIFKKESAPKKD